MNNIYSYYTVHNLCFLLQLFAFIIITNDKLSR